MNKYLISIIIPTRNRQSYALETIKQIVEINCKKMQIVVQDNSSDNLLENAIRDMKNENIKYGYIKEQVSFVDNFSRGIDLADGEYICAIGDDDGILSDIIEVVEYAKEVGINAILPSLAGIYTWPESGIRRGADNGVLGLSKITELVKIVSPKNELNKFFKNGCLDYLDFNLAKVYQGIVKKEYMEIIKQKTGAYFKGLSPDIYSAVCLSMLVDKLLVIDYPLTISGMCKKSGSADSATGRHVGALSNAPHFKGHDGYVWEKQVPEFYSVETIWADSAIAAIKDMGENELYDEFNSIKLLIRLKGKYKKYNKEINSAIMQKANENKFTYYIMSIEIFFYNFLIKNIILIKRIIRRIFRTKKKFILKYDLQNISAAGIMMQHLMKEFGYDVKNVIKNIKKLIVITQ